MSTTNSGRAACPCRDQAVREAGVGTEIGGLPLGAASGRAAAVARRLVRGLLSGLLGMAALAVATAADGGRSAAEAQAITPLDKPEGLLLWAGSGFAASEAIEATWDTVANASGYELRYREDTVSAWTDWTTTVDSQSVSWATITGLTNGTKYQVQVKATGTGNFSDSSWSNNGATGGQTGEFGATPAEADSSQLKRPKSDKRNRTGLDLLLRPKGNPERIQLRFPTVMNAHSYMLSYKPVGRAWGSRDEAGGGSSVRITDFTGSCNNARNLACQPNSDTILVRLYPPHVTGGVAYNFR